MQFRYADLLFHKFNDVNVMIIFRSGSVVPAFFFVYIIELPDMLFKTDINYSSYKLSVDIIIFTAVSFEYYFMRTQYT